MLFKNAFIYRLTREFRFDADSLVEHLSKHAFVPCSGIRPSSFGWISPLGQDDAALAHEVAGCLLLCARREDKVVPGSALQEATLERVQRLETSEGRKLSNRERLSLKEDTLAELLPRALPRSRQVMGYIAPADQLLVVGSSSPTEAELFTQCLQASLESIPLVPPRIKANPSAIFTRWLSSRQLPDHFSFGDQCDLIDVEDGATVRCRRMDLDTREVRTHLEAGMHCTRIGLRWHGDLSCVVDRDLSLKQIKMSGSDADIDDLEDPIARLDAAFAYTTLELGRFLPELFDALGGEQQDG